MAQTHNYPHQPRRHFDHEGRPIWLRRDASGRHFELEQNDRLGLRGLNPPNQGRRLEDLKPGGPKPPGGNCLSHHEHENPYHEPIQPENAARFQASNATFRQPSYDCRELADAVTIVVYVPGVDASGVEIEAHGPDLVVTARKTRFVRVNWQALNLEGSQRDYRLRLRLGLGFDFSQMQAGINDGVLTLSVPKRQADLAPAHRLGCVA